MARRVHLHIGTMKSATTYLQDLCEQHLDRFVDAGVLWPSGIVRYAGVRDFFGRADAQTDPQGASRRLLRQISEHPGDVVLSNELLAGVEQRRVGRLVEALSPAVVHVVITARDPARVIPSAWQTAIRNGEKTYTWAEYSLAVCSDSSDAPFRDVRERFWHHHDVADLVRRWQPFVGDERISLVTVPPSGGDRDAIALRFGTAIGVDLTGLSKPKARGNSTLGAYSAELIRRVNVELAGADKAARKYGIRNALADSSLGARAKREPEFGLSPAQHAWATERAQRMVDELRLMDLNIQGDLADLIPTPRSSADAVVDPGDTTDAELLEAAVQGLIGMARHAAKLRLKGNDMRDEVEQLKAERDALLAGQGLPQGSKTRFASLRLRSIVRRIRS